MKCYYAHSIALFNTKTEKRDIKLLELLGLDVENPNTEKHINGFEHEGMDYYMQLIESEIELIAFRANPDGTINAGTSQEVKRGMELGLPIIELPCSVHKRTNSKIETEERLKNQGIK